MTFGIVVLPALTRVPPTASLAVVYVSTLGMWSGNGLGWISFFFFLLTPIKFRMRRCAQ